MRISIAMATYNGERFLAQQLSTISKQTRQPDELVIVDDCSVDGTMEILHEYAEGVAFPVRTAANTKNLGYSRTFEAAIALCHGDIICFCDQDDVWRPKKLAQVEQAFLNNPLAMCVKHDLCLVNASNAVLSPSIFRMLRQQGRTPEFLTKGCATAARSQFLTSIMPIPEDFGWAYDDWPILMAEASGKLLTLSDVLADYRLHGSNASGKLPRRGLFARCERILQWTLFGHRRPSIFPHKHSQALLELLRIGKATHYIKEANALYLERNITIVTIREKLLTFKKSSRILPIIRTTCTRDAYLIGAATLLGDIFRAQIPR